MILDDIFYVKFNWKKIDKEEFYLYRIKNLKRESSEDFTNLNTSGSSSCRQLKYKWGPNFARHHAAYDDIFYDGQKYIHLFILPNQENSINRTERAISLGVNDGIPKNDEKLLNDMHIVSNPEVLYIYINRYGDFIENFFNKKNCTFSFTGSPLKKEFRFLFESLGMKCKDHMRCWDGGATYYTCQYGNKHWAEFSSIIRFEGQKLLSTDLWNTAQKFINYWNKDRLFSKPVGICECGLEAVEIEWIENPRYFVVNGKEYCYDAVVEIAKNYGDFDFLSVEYSDSLAVISVCSVDKINLSGFEKNMTERLGAKVIVKEAKLPEYRRKYQRIRKMKKLL